MKNLENFSCIQACLQCAAACNHCAASCTKEEDVKMMAKCIELDMQYAAICYATAQLLSLGSDKSAEICALCAAICIACAEECGLHLHMHCQDCAATCRKCAEECQKMVVAA